MYLSQHLMYRCFEISVTAYYLLATYRVSQQGRQAALPLNLELGILQVIVFCML